MLAHAARRPRLSALALGALSATGFAPLGLWPITLACFSIVLILLNESSNRRAAFALGWCFGVGHFTVGLNWIAHAFSFQDKMPPQLGYLAVLLLALYLALFPGMAIFIAVFGFNMLGDALRDVLDPRLRGSR